MWNHFYKLIKQNQQKTENESHNLKESKKYDVSPWKAEYSFCSIAKNDEAQYWAELCKYILKCLWSCSLHEI